MIMDISNKQLVGVQGDMITIMLARSRMTRQEAIIHAAWLVALADTNDEFESVLEQVRNT